MRRPITSRMHAMLDYPLAVVLIATPWIFGFSDVGGAAVALPIIVSALALGVEPDHRLGAQRREHHSACNAFDVDARHGVVLAICICVRLLCKKAPMYGCRRLSPASECSSTGPYDAARCRGAARRPRTSPARR